MKKNYIIILLFFLGFFTVKAQVTLVDQPTGGTSGIVSDVIATNGYGTYTADDFTLTESYTIDTITAYGFCSDGSDITTNMTGLDVYIYEDVSGLPSSDPTSSGTGVLELVNLSPTSSAVSIVNNEITIDVEAALGSELELTAGTYWVSVAPRVPSDDVRWNWYMSNTGGNAVLFDEGNFGGFSWMDFVSLGLTFDSVAFTIVGTEALSVEEYSVNKVSISPNPTQDFININFQQPISEFSTELYDVTGKLVLKSNNVQRLDISNLVSGIYVLKISTYKGTVSKRIIKN